MFDIFILLFPPYVFWQQTDDDIFRMVVHHVPAKNQQLHSLIRPWSLGRVKPRRRQPRRASVGRRCDVRLYYTNVACAVATTNNEAR